MSLCFLEQCSDGFKEFQKTLDESLLNEIKKAQKPQALVIGCSDSRVDPALLFSCSPGDIFVIRNVANIVPCYEQEGSIHGVSAAIEYAVCSLHVQHIILLGHSQCGGIEALYAGSSGEFVAPWVNIVSKAKENVEKCHPGFSKEEKMRCCELEALRISYNNLKTFPFIREKVANKKLELHSWFFTLEEAKLSCFNMERICTP